VCCVQEVRTLRRFSIRVKGAEFLEMEERGICYGGKGRRRTREVVLE